MDPNRHGIETGPQCPRCGRTYPVGYRFCGGDGARLVEPNARTQACGRRRTVSHCSLLIAQRYLRIRALGEGGQANVSLVHDIRTNRMLALKEFRSEMDVERCRAELKAAAQIRDHTHIVRVYELDRDPVTQRHFMTLEYLEGETLEDRLARGPRGMRESVSILLQVARGLSEMHRRALVHRDVKPANIMVRDVDHDDGKDPHVKLLDLGMAKSLAPGARPLTVPGSVVGTLDYAAPEQLRGEPVSPAFDIYALGVVAHELLEGCLPTEPARGSRPIPEGLRMLHDQMLQKDPAGRPARMANVCSALERAERWLSLEAPRRPPARVTASRPRPRMSLVPRLAFSVPTRGPRGDRFDDTCYGDPIIPQRSFLPRFAAATAALVVAVGSLFTPVLGSEDPGAIAVNHAPPVESFEVDAITFDPGPIDFTCGPPTDAATPC